MVKILFTKKIPFKLQVELQRFAEVESFNILKIKPLDSKSLNVDLTVSHHLLSSKNALSTIESLPIEGEFFVVGKKSKNQLEKWNKKVTLCSATANDLATKIIQQIKPTTWNFYCGNNRRDELIDKLTKANHKVHEIVCYQSIAQNKNFDSNFDAIVLLSPLSAKTFFKNNQISSNTIIFTIGKTTTFEVQKYTNHSIITSSLSTLEDIIENIKKTYDTN